MPSPGAATADAGQAYEELDLDFVYKTLDTFYRRAGHTNEWSNGRTNGERMLVKKNKRAKTYKRRCAFKKRPIGEKLMSIFV